MKIADQDICAITALGYAEDEARFLYIVATHSGYFIPRQFLKFTGAKWGYKTDKFTKKLERRGHASWREYEGTGGVYHLFSKTLYGEIGKENLRNRRRHSVEFIKTRLVLLDFILTNLSYDYLETEQQKVQYFCERLALPKSSLPAKAYVGRSQTEPTLRYFVDKYPLFLNGSSVSSSPVVTLSYVDPGYATLAGFVNHLNAYDSLLRRLSGFRFLYISNSTAHFGGAGQCFSSRLKGPLSLDNSADVLKYFRFRKAWELKKYGLFATQDIEWLKQATSRFQGSRFEGLYSAWCGGLLNEGTLVAELSHENLQRGVEFGTVLVKGTRFAAMIPKK